MAKLFRKAMGEARAENRVGQYLLLALGEIIFVIIGILLALYINNWNLERQKEADVEAIFSEILKDLEKDIFYIEGSIALQKRKDSLIQLVFEDSLTVTDYESNPTLRNLIFQNKTKDLYDKGFVALMKNIDHIPPKFEPVMPALQQLYVQMKGHVVRSNHKIQAFVTGTISKWSNKHAWFYLYIRDGAVNKDAFEYFVSDPMYKNEIALYRVYLIENVNKSAMTYYHQAILSYKEIFQILHPNQKLPEFISAYIIELPPSEMRKLEGSYYTVKNDFTYKIKVIEDQLHLVYGENPDQKLMFLPKSPTRFFEYQRNAFMTFTSDEKGEIIGMDYKQGKVEFNFEKQDESAE